MNPGVGKWRGFGVSVTGVSHDRTGHPCQDAFALRFVDGDTVVAAVADGAGSTTYGGVGARLAVDQAVQHVAAWLEQDPPQDEEAWQGILADAFQSARHAIQTAAGETPLREYAATLSLLAAHADPRGEAGYVAGAAVGDCAMVVQDGAGSLLSLCPPRRGEYANATSFLTQPNALEQIDFHFAPGRFTHLALLSDGLLELALNLVHNRPFAPFFDPLFAFVAVRTTEAMGSIPPVETVDPVEKGETETEDKPPADVGREEPANSESSPRLNGVGDPDASARQALAAFLNSERVNARTHDDKTLVLLTWGNHAPPDL